MMKGKIDMKTKQQQEKPASLITQWPWKYDPETGMVESSMPDLKNEYGHVCDLRQDWSGNYSNSDGRLIASAPELLWAAKGALDYLYPKHNNGHTRAWTEAMMFALREAIEKAEGQQ